MTLGTTRISAWSIMVVTAVLLASTVVAAVVVAARWRSDPGEILADVSAGTTPPAAPTRTPAPARGLAAAGAAPGRRALAAGGPHRRRLRAGDDIVRPRTAAAVRRTRL